MPDGVVNIVVHIQVGGAEPVFAAVLAQVQRAAEQLGLEVVKLVGQSRFLWKLAGQIIHGGQAVAGRSRRIDLFPHWLTR